MNLTRCQPFLGTYVEISVDAEGEFGDLAELSNIGFQAIEFVSNNMSFHNLASELTKVNQQAVNASVKVSAELNEVIQFCLQLSAQTDGVFDITVAPYLIREGLLPRNYDSKAVTANWESIELMGNEIFFSEPLLIDLGGVAKGYAVDLAMQRIKAKNSEAKVTINAGGDLRMSHWKEEIAHVHSNTKNKLVPLCMQNSALCTSSYQYLESGQPGHVIHPKLGNVHPLSHSVSVFSPCCMHSDALTKVAALAPESEVFSYYHATVAYL